MSRINHQSTKKGVASFYVVIFATILFGVITLSFIRIILSESGQSSNDDLSQSAYDSALVGVEDAKRAVDQYYECLDSGGDDNSCGPLFGGNCDDFYLRDYLGYEGEGEVLVQESTSNNSDQAYTCVILSNVVSDYRSTLTSDTPSRVVPLGIGSTELTEIKNIKFQWYSEINGTEFKNLDHDGRFADKANATTPPTISLTLIRTAKDIDLNSYNNSTSGSYSTMVFLPVDNASGPAETTIGADTIAAAGNSDKAAQNEPFEVECEPGEFACTVNLNTSSPGFFTAEGNAILVISMPYGDLVTDFAVTLEDGDGNAINFENVQVSVDSTGRANQLLRRVETRLDPADIFFPYPQYAVELSGDPDEALSKYFWITANCWTEKGACANNGTIPEGSL